MPIIYLFECSLWYPLKQTNLFTAFSSPETGSRAVYSRLQNQMCYQSWISIRTHLLQVLQWCRVNTRWPSLYYLTDPLEQSQTSVYKLTDCKHSHTHAHMQTCTPIDTLHSRALELTRTQQILFNFSIPFTQQYFLFVLYISLYPKGRELCCRFIGTKPCWTWYSCIGLLSQRRRPRLKERPHGTNLKNRDGSFNKRSFHPSFVQKLITVISSFACKKSSSCQNKFRCDSRSWRNIPFDDKICYEDDMEVPTEVWN